MIVKKGDIEAITLTMFFALVIGIIFIISLGYMTVTGFIGLYHFVTKIVS